MKLLKVKTARFREVVEKCGQPEIHTLWLKPEKDKRFQVMVKNNRIMTVKAGDTGTEFGTVGFRKEKGARYLAFPKSLKKYEGKRIIGIDWLLVQT